MRRFPILAAILLTVTDLRPSACQAVQTEPQDAEFYNKRGGDNIDKGDLDNAISDFNKAIQLKPDLQMLT